MLRMKNTLSEWFEKIQALVVQHKTVVYIGWYE